MTVAAVFYDLIPAKMPELYQAATMDEFAAYWDVFAEADLALPISWTAAADLCRYLTKRELRAQVVPCMLVSVGTPQSRTPRQPPEPGEPLRLLAGGTWEPRKNYPRLLRAIGEARLLAPERPIRLTIVGFRGGWAEHVAEIERLAAEVDDIDLRDHISDQALLHLYHTNHATVYGSWEEGFGLPVVESLWHGLPCLCHDGSAMAETAPGGGVIAVDMLDQTVIARSIARLAREDGLLDRLMREAVARPIRTWDEYAQDVMSAIGRTGITAPSARVHHVKLPEVPAFDLALHEDQRIVSSARKSGGQAIGSRWRRNSSAGCCPLRRFIDPAPI
jgi:glycosyltransferase involved in cell wall biosynthesis